MKNFVAIFSLFMLFFVVKVDAQEINTVKENSGNSVSNTHKSIILYTNPLQMFFYGEYQLGVEKEKTDKYSYVWGIGLIYRTKETNRKLIIVPTMVSDYYEGINLFAGVKQYFYNYFTVTNMIYVKYEKDFNFNIVDGYLYDRFLGLSGSYYFFNKKVTRDKYVLGYKFLLGLQNKKTKGFICNFYGGGGIHIKYWKTSPYKIAGEIIHNEKLLPEITIHLGFTIGYN